MVPTAKAPVPSDGRYTLLPSVVDPVVKIPAPPVNPITVEVDTPYVWAVNGNGDADEVRVIGVPPKVVKLVQETEPEQVTVVVAMVLSVPLPAVVYTSPFPVRFERFVIDWVELTEKLFVAVLYVSPAPAVVVA